MRGWQATRLEQVGASGEPHETSRDVLHVEEATVLQIWHFEEQRVSVNTNSFMIVGLSEGIYTVFFVYRVGAHKILSGCISIVCCETSTAGSYTNMFVYSYSNYRTLHENFTRASILYIYNILD